MQSIILIFLAAALLFYLLFGGADFGAGILQFFASKKDHRKAERIMYRAIGPVWEVNHIWLIIMIVILFIAFPPVFNLISIHLHIPIMIMMVGIILRGTAFTFRHYDAIKDSSHRIYSKIFEYASILTPLFLGMIGGAVILGRIEPIGEELVMEKGFFHYFMAPWLNVFSVAMGLFVVGISAFMAAVFLAGEAHDEHFRKIFEREAFIANVLTFISGIMVFIWGEIEGLEILATYTDHPASWVMLVTAAGLQVVLWRAFRRRKFNQARLIAGGQISLMLASWAWAFWPMAINLSGGEALMFTRSFAPDQSIQALGWALLVGGLLIFPALWLLMRTFKFEVDE